MPNFIEIGGVTRKPLVDLTRNDPQAEIERIRGHNQTGSVVLELMLGDEGDQQEKIATTEMRILRGILGVSRRDHT